MRAIVFDGTENTLVDGVTVRDPGPGEVRVRIVASGLCQSDLSVVNGKIPFPVPVILGHEGAGVVEEVGPGVTSPAVGDHVVLSTLATCGQCAACTSGHPTMCRESFGKTATPFELDGTPVHNYATLSTFSEQIVVQAGQAVPIPKDISLATACLIGCAVLTGAGAVLNRARVAPGDSVVVIGSGGIGLNVIQAARVAGATTIIAIRPFCFRFDKALFRQIMGIGLPAGIQMSLVAVGAMVVMSKINSFGKEYTAAYNVGSKLDSLAFLPVQSLSNAVTAFVGQNIGARRLDRARQGIRITVAASVAWSAVMLVLIPLGPTLVGFFSDTPAVIQSGSVYLKCIMPFYLLFSVMFCLNNAMRGAGDSLFAMVDVIFSLILVRVPAVYWFADHYGPDYMYYGVGVGWCVGFTLSVVYYLSGRWKRKGSLADKNP